MIDIHQHLNYGNRSNEDLINHQKKMGVDLTVLLPSAGSHGCDNGLLARVSDTAHAYQFVKNYSGFAFAANAPVSQIDTLCEYIDKGAKMIGEIKYEMEGNSGDLWTYAEVAQQYKIPILIHFEKGTGTNLNEFEETLKKFPEVNFIGHAVQWWSEIDGLMGRMMLNYNNLFGDISAASGLCALSGPHGKEFVYKHQDRLLFGSDCPDKSRKRLCVGQKIIKQIKSMVGEDIYTKIFHNNAQKLLCIGEGEQNEKLG